MELLFCLFYNYFYSRKKHYLAKIGGSWPPRPPVVGAMYNSIASFINHFLFHQFIAFASIQLQFNQSKIK